MAAFKNTANGHTEYVGGGASAGVFFFGAIYLAIKGLWAHVFIWIAVVGGLTVLTGGPGLLIALPLAGIIYACAIQSILESSYLKRGWVRVEAQAVHSPTAERTCPLCAETIKMAAVKCKHCGADVEAVEPPPLQGGWVAATACLSVEARNQAASQITEQGFQVVDIGEIIVAAGPFATKEEAKHARAVLREKYHLLSDVQYRSSVSG